MRLTIVLALVCFSQTVLSAPAVTHKHTHGDVATTKQRPSDTLELELQGFNNNLPSVHHHKNQQQNEPLRRESEVAATNNGAPEVKRSERVDVDDVENEKENDLSGNMKLADEEVKTVLKTFFQNLKHHPEIVEDILEREGAKLMQSQTLEEGGEGEESLPEEHQSAEAKSEETDSEQRPQAEDSNTIPKDISDFQKPSPQLMKSPKQVEKKAGPLPGYPGFVYKSPMRNTKERDELTARSLNNPELESPPSNDISPNNIVVSDGNTHGDLSNAIPVVQAVKQDVTAAEEEALIAHPEEGGDVDLAALERAQEEYSREHPFVNTLPLFPGQAGDDVVAKDVVENDAKNTQKTDHVDDEVNTEENIDEVQADDNESAESDEKRSGKPEVEAQEVNSAEKTDADETGGQWSETQVVEKPLNSQEELSHGSQETDKGSVHFRPYYYYYNEDELKADDDKLDAVEEGEEEDENENQLHKISVEADVSDEKVGDSKEEEKVEEEVESDEDIDEPEHDEEEEEDDESAEHDAEEEDETAEHAEEEEDETAEHAEEEEEDETAEHDDEEEKDTESIEHVEGVNQKHNPRNSESENIEETGVMPHQTQSEYVSRTEIDNTLDKNEADLLALFRNSQQKTANRPIAGPPM